MSPGLAVYIHNCPIQEWVVDHLVSLLAPRVFQEHATEYPTDLVLQNAVTHGSVRQRSNSRLGNAGGKGGNLHGSCG